MPGSTPTKVSTCIYKKNGQRCPTGQWCPTVSYFETLAIGSRTYYAARGSASGESGYLQVTVAVLFSATWHCFVKYVTWFLTLYISGSDYLVIFSLFMHTVILPTVCVKEEWIFLYCFTLLRSTNFRKPRHSHVISRGMFAPRLCRVAPLKDV
jgi:hypothetical protein